MEWTILAEMKIHSEFGRDELGVVMVGSRRLDANDLLQCDDVAIDFAQNIDYQSRTDLPIQPATLVDIVRYDPDAISIARNIHTTPILLDARERFKDSP